MKIFSALISGAVLALGLTAGTANSASILTIDFIFEIDENAGNNPRGEAFGLDFSDDPTGLGSIKINLDVPAASSSSTQSTYTDAIAGFTLGDKDFGNFAAGTNTVSIKDGQTVPSPGSFFDVDFKDGFSANLSLINDTDGVDEALVILEMERSYVSGSSNPPITTSTNLAEILKIANDGAITPTSSNLLLLYLTGTYNPVDGSFSATGENGSFDGIAARFSFFPQPFLQDFPDGQEPSFATLPPPTGDEGGQVSTVPVPAALPLLAAALGGMGLLRDRRKRAAA